MACQQQATELKRMSPPRRARISRFPGFDRSRRPHQKTPQKNRPGLSSEPAFCHCLNSVGGSGNSFNPANAGVPPARNKQDFTSQVGSIAAFAPP